MLTRTGHYAFAFWEKILCESRYAAEYEGRIWDRNRNNPLDNSSPAN